MANFPTIVPAVEYEAWAAESFDRETGAMDAAAEARRRRDEQERLLAAQQPRQFSPFDAVFRRHAGALGSNDEFIAIVSAGTNAESGWNPQAIGDQGHSAGIFMMHDQGAGAGLTLEQRMDPEFSSSRMVPAYAQAYQRIKAANPGLQGPELASLVAATAERPKDWENPNSPARRNYATAYHTVIGSERPAPTRVLDPRDVPIVPPGVSPLVDQSHQDFLSFADGLDRERAQRMAQESYAQQQRMMSQRRPQASGLGGSAFGMMPGYSQDTVMDPRDRGIVPPPAQPRGQSLSILPDPNLSFDDFANQLDQQYAQQTTGITDSVSPVPPPEPSPFGSTASRLSAATESFGAPPPPVLDPRDAGVVPPTANPSTSPVPNQFGDPALSQEEALAACGHAAYVAFARSMGRNPTLREAVDLAKQYGWNSSAGMAGPASQVRMLNEQGIPAEMGGLDPARIDAELVAGRPVSLSTPGHYFVLSSRNEDGSYHVGPSGTAYRSGRPDMTLEQMQQIGGRTNGVIYLAGGGGAAPVSAPAPASPAPESSRPGYVQSFDEYAAELDGQYLQQRRPYAYEESQVMDPRDRGVAPPEARRPETIGPVDVNDYGPMEHLRSGMSRYPENPGRAMAEMAGDVATGALGRNTRDRLMQENPDLSEWERQHRVPIGEEGIGLGAAIEMAADPVSYLPGPRAARAIGDVAQAGASATGRVLSEAADALSDPFADAARAADPVGSYASLPFGFGGTRTPGAPARGSDVLKEMIGERPRESWTDAIPRTPTDAANRLVVDWFKRDKGIFDRESAVADAYRLATGSDELPGNLRAADMIRNLPGVAQQARMRIEAELGPAITPIRQARGTALEDFSAYLAANDVLDKAAVIGAKFGGRARATRQWSGKTEAEIRDGLTKLESEVGPDLWRQFQDSSGQVRRYVDGIREDLVDAGVLSREQADYYKSAFPHYVPIDIIERQPAGAGASRAGFGVSDSGVRHLTEEGTKKFMNNPTVALAEYGRTAERRIAMNKAARAINDWRAIDPNAAALMREVPRTYQPVKGEGVLQFFEDGVPKTVAVQEPFATLLQDAPQVVTGDMQKVWVQLMSFFREAATARNPGFALGANPILDAAPYLLKSEIDYGVRRTPQIFEEYAKALFTDVFQGLGTGQMRGPGTREYLSGGGGMGGHSYIGKDANLDDIVNVIGRERLIETKADVARVLKQMATLDWVPAIGERLELTPRVAKMRLEQKYGPGRELVFEKWGAQGKIATAKVRPGDTKQIALLTKQGYVDATPPPDRRARQLDETKAGANATLDFRQGGRYAKELNPFIPFLNVSLQPTPWLVQAARGHGKNAAAALTFGVVLPTIVADIWNNMDESRRETYRDIPRHITDGNITIVLDGFVGHDEHGNPKHDYRVLPMRPVAPIVAMTHSFFRQAMADARPDEWRSLLNGIMSTTTPLSTESGAAVAGSVISGPPGTGVQLALGEDLYRDRRIVSERSNEQASAPAKWVAERLGVEPGAVEFAVRDGLAGYGNMILAAGDLARRIKDGESIFPQDMAAGEAPVTGGLAGRFVGHRGGQQARDLSKLRDQTRDGFIAEQQAQPGWAALSPAEQRQVEGRMGVLANMLVHGTDARPETVISGLKENVAFRAFPPEERTEILAALRETLAAQSREMRQETRTNGTPKWLAVLDRHGITPDLGRRSDVPPARAAEYERALQRDVRHAVETVVKSSAYLDQPAEAQREALEEAMSLARDTVNREFVPYEGRSYREDGFGPKMIDKDQGDRPLSGGEEARVRQVRRDATRHESLAKDKYAPLLTTDPPANSLEADPKYGRYGDATSFDREGFRLRLDLVLDKLRDDFEKRGQRGR